VVHATQEEEEDRPRTPADIAPAKCQQTRSRSEFTAASHSFPATAWLSCFSDPQCISDDFAFYGIVSVVN